MDISVHKLSLQQTLKGVEAQLNFLGPGPHTPQQKDELQKLTEVKQKLLEQIKVASAQEKTPPQSSPAPSSSPAMQQSSPMLVSTSLAMPRTVVPSKPQAHVVLSKPRPPVPPFMIQAQPKDDSKILNKQRLQELVKEVDPTEQLDEDVEEMLMQITDDFIESVVSASCDLAKHRKSNTLEVKDLKLHLEKQWNITIPGYGADDVKPLKKSAATDAHKQRLALIRKATKK